MHWSKRGVYFAGDDVEEVFQEDHLVLHPLRLRVSAGINAPMDCCIEPLHSAQDTLCGTGRPGLGEIQLRRTDCGVVIDLV
jgi:hypothetical protein